MIFGMTLALMKKGDNHQRTIAVQVLANLSKSEPKQRMSDDPETLTTGI